MKKSLMGKKRGEKSTMSKRKELKKKASRQREDQLERGSFSEPDSSNAQPGNEGRSDRSWRGTHGRKGEKNPVQRPAEEEKEENNPS